jgi:hypothetical protein
MAKSHYSNVIETTISGIPCRIGITHYYVQKPMGMWADSADDCYGYTDLEYDILDRKGYQADWLARKLTSQDEDRISEEVAEYFSDMANDYDY